MDKTSALRKLDDILTTLTVDNLSLWFATRKFQPKDNTLKKVKNNSLTEDIKASIFMHVIQKKSFKDAIEELESLLGRHSLLPHMFTPSCKALKDHIKRFLMLYHPNAGIEISSTRQYEQLTVGSVKKPTFTQACILATKEFKKDEDIQYLQGFFSPLTPQQLDRLKADGSDFSVMLFSRKVKSHLLLGPARFVNHDCNPNTAFQFHDTQSIIFRALRPIDFGEEITVSYGNNYFGINNCECLCRSCEIKTQDPDPALLSPKPKLAKRYLTRTQSADVNKTPKDFTVFLPKESNKPYFLKSLKRKESSVTDVEDSPVLKPKRILELSDLLPNITGHPNLIDFRIGFNAYPTQLTQSKMQSLLDSAIKKQCEWCNNVDNNLVLPRTHRPNIFLAPLEGSALRNAKLGKLSHLSKYVHVLDETTMLCLRCNRHYEIFALPWPFREYPSAIKRCFFREPSEEASPKRFKQEVQPKIRLVLRIPDDYFEWKRNKESSTPEKAVEPNQTDTLAVQKYPLVLIGRKLSIKSRCWPGLLLPVPLVKLLSPESDPGADAIVYRLSDGLFKVVPKEKIHRMDKGCDHLFQTLHSIPELVDRPGMRRALAYVESDALPSDLLSLLLAKPEDEAAPHLKNLPFQTSPESSNETISKFSCQPGESWLALFPKEGFSELPITILESKVFDKSTPTHAQPGLHYKVQLTDTDTLRWVVPAQLIKRHEISVL
ncbi:histone lysine methyltransferase Set9 [Entomophthora muscae]|uniref:Histone lysine methyltransferase Set9 n=1 Tax=Entomophthora muscae TaxID=34485 RepID=A0ACC2U035_9FUNG|nr:histone lysine methyltransferase Set9 [Entomophthora muscae]